MLFDLNHLQETEMSYTRHLIHGMDLGMWLFFCSLLSFINCIFNNKNIQNFINARIKEMYHGLMLRWFEDSNFNPVKPKKDAIREKHYKKEYIENIQKGIIKPFSNIRMSYELLITSVSSIIHSIVPQILVHVAAMNVIKLYFSIKIVEK